MDPWLHVFETESKFLWFEPLFPRYKDQPVWVLVRIWFVVRNTKTDDYYLWSKTLAHKKEGGVIAWRWQELEGIVEQMTEEASDEIESDMDAYIEFLDFVAWSAAPFKSKLTGNIKLYFQKRGKRK